MAIMHHLHCREMTLARALIPMFALLAAACTTAGTVPTGAPAWQALSTPLLQLLLAPQAPTPQSLAT